MCQPLLLFEVHADRQSPQFSCDKAPVDLVRAAFQKQTKDATQEARAAIEHFREQLPGLVNSAFELCTQQYNNRTKLTTVAFEVFDQTVSYDTQLQLVRKALTEQPHKRGGGTFVVFQRAAVDIWSNEATPTVQIELASWAHSAGALVDPLIKLQGTITQRKTKLRLQNAIERWSSRETDSFIGKV